MIETNIPNLNVEEIMQHIKDEVQKRKSVDSTLLQDTSKHQSTRTYTQVDLNLTIFKSPSFTYKNHYELSDFTQYHDETFIKTIYRAILKRDPDTGGMQRYLQLLRSGERSKTEIIVALRFSREGKSKKVTILGINKRFIVASLYRVPVLGYISKSLVTLFTLPKLLKRLNHYESQLTFQNGITNSNALLLQEAINKKTDIENLHVELATKSDKQTEEDLHKFDTFYVEFENKFRGTREDIKQRVKVYLPYLEELPFKKEDIKALDVGCGRGEWIELLGDRGYDVHGIDLNSIMVSKSQELGLNVKEADVIEYLQSLEDESLSVITGFHIIEHLPFEVLMKMYEESYRVLKSGGMVIFETPNPENLIVGACNFYSDPTHINPLVPESSRFILESRSFKNCKIQRLNLMKKINYIEDTNFNDVNDLLYASSKEQDYAVRGYKL